MRILFCRRLDARAKYGGDLRVIEMYAQGLRRLGCDVVVSDRLHEDYRAFDVVHFTSLACSFEIYLRMRRIRALSRPPRTVLTPFHHKIAWLLSYYRQCLGIDLGAARDQGYFRFNALMTAKDTLRYALALRHHPRLLAYLGAFRTTFRQKQYIVNHVDALLVHAEAEAAAVRNDFQAPDTPAYTVPVGRESSASGTAPPGLPKDFILSVGRIEPLKNQLTLMEAVRQLGVPVVLVGAINLRHPGYARRFQVALDGREVTHFHRTDRSMLNALYQHASLHVIASWVEVFPMTTVEAAVNGCRFVTTRNSYESDVYGNDVEYLDPADPESISGTITRTLHTPGLGRPALVLESVPTWDRAAEDLLQVYRTVADRTRSWATRPAD